MTEGHYTADPNFVMPPRDPATPRPIDVERERRAEAARSQRAQDIRSQALSVAASISGANADLFWSNVDALVLYITDGTAP